MFGYTVFHNKIMEGLFQNIKDNSVANAYIFTGNRGLFKHESASLFAMALSCKRQNPPCGVCEGCTLASARSNPDIKHICVPKDKTKIDVDTIRSLNKDVVVRPFTSSRKIYIIDEGDAMNEAAQNAFLKTFEEPPEYAVFIIVAENIDNLLPTIVSRAVVISFSPLSKDKIKAYLKKEHPNQLEKESFLVNYSEGIPGKLSEIISDEDFYKRRHLSLKMLPHLLSKNIEDAFVVEEYVQKNSDNAAEIFDFWISFLRDLLVIKLGAFENVINTDLQSEIRLLLDRASEKEVTEAIKLLVESKKMLALHIKPSAVAIRCALKTLK